MSKGSKLINFGEDLLADLECYQAITGATATNVIKIAVSDFINRTLDENEGLRRRFLELREKDICDSTGSTKGKK